MVAPGSNSKSAWMRFISSDTASSHDRPRAKDGAAYWRAPSDSGTSGVGSHMLAGTRSSCCGSRRIASRTASQPSGAGAVPCDWVIEPIDCDWVCDGVSATEGRAVTSTRHSIRTRSMRCAPCRPKCVTMLPKLSTSSRRSSAGGSICTECDSRRCHGSIRGVRRASCHDCDTGAV